MTSLSKNLFSRFAAALLLILLVAGLAAGYWASRRPTPQPHSVAPVPLAAPVANLASPIPVTAAPKLSAVKSGVLPNWTNFQDRPFPSAYESSQIQWTLPDGKDTNIIRQLAHNRLEYDRMVEENPRIFQRQLVYLKETAAEVFENAKRTGAPVTQLTLPGLDGQELPFEITQSEGGGSSRHGMFSGHLVGNHDSLVTLAFQDGREAFTVLSPKENIFVVGEPREDGQVVVKAIDPNTYGVGPEEKGDDSVGAQPVPK